MIKKLKYQVIIDFNKVHNYKYDYSLVDYVNSRDKVKIICKEHGVFEQRPNSHLNGQRCPICTNHIKLTKEVIINRSNIIHNNKYDYSLFNEYNTQQDIIKIICPIHGISEQKINNHLNGKGCKYCANNVIKTTKDIKINFNKIHNDRYVYSLVYYKNAKTKVKIICKEHGIFEQSPNNHLKGVGCPLCYNITKKEECYLYVIYDKIYDLYKIGITKNYKKRMWFIGKSISKNINLIYMKENFGHNENIIHELYHKYRINHPIKHGGYTEWFNFKGLEINDIINEIENIKTLL